MGRLMWVTIIITILVLGITYGAKSYLASQTFASLLDQKLSRALGKDIVISGPIEWQSVYPNIRARLDKVELKDPANDGGVSRIRLRNIEVSLPARVLGKRTDISDLVLRIDHAGVVVEKLTTEEPAVIDLADFISTASRIRAPHIAVLDITEIDVIDRRAAEPTHYRAKNVHLDLGYAGIKSEGSYAIGAGDFIPLSLAFVRDTSQERLTFSLTARTQLPQQDVPQGAVLTTLVAFDPAYLKIRDLRIEKGNNLITGALEYETTQNALSGSIAIKRLELTDVINLDHSDLKQSDRMLPSVPYPYDILARVNAKIQIHTGAVRYTNTPVVNGTFKLTVQNGDAEIVGLGLSALGAPVTLNWSAKSLSTTPAFSLALTADDLALERLNLLTTDDTFFRDGTGQISANITYAGNSLRGHTTTSLGVISFNASSGEISPTFVQWLDKSIVSHGKQLAQDGRAITREPEASAVKLPCVNIFFALNNGYAAANKSIVIETADNMFVSSGYIDFHTEKLGFTFTSNTKETFDWSPLSTTKYVQLDGTLKSPTISLNPQETLKQGMLTASTFIFGPVPSLAYMAMESAQNRTQERPVCLPHKQTTN